MIKDKKALSLIEAGEYIEKEDKKAESLKFIKKFSKTNIKEAKELRKKFEDLDMIKLNDKKISKIIDTLPETKEELNKIFTDIGLNEDESKKILDTLKTHE